jgi:hypothetical protein
LVHAVYPAAAEVETLTEEEQNTLARNVRRLIAQPDLCEARADSLEAGQRLLEGKVPASALQRATRADFAKELAVLAEEYVEDALEQGLITLDRLVALLYSPDGLRAAAEAVRNSNALMRDVERIQASVLAELQEEPIFAFQDSDYPYSDPVERESFQRDAAGFGAKAKDKDEDDEEVQGFDEDEDDED